MYSSIRDEKPVGMCMCSLGVGGETGDCQSPIAGSPLNRKDFTRAQAEEDGAPLVHIPISLAGTSYPNTL